MLPGIGGSELIIIAIVALVVVGPKDLPKLLRNIGKFVGRMRNMADDFKASFDDMARQTELDELRKEVEALRANNIGTSIQNDMRAIENDVQTSLSKAEMPGIETPGVDAPGMEMPTQTEITDPQMDGLPPRWDAGQVETSELDAPAKRPRVRKAKAVAEAAETVADAPAEPVKRSRAKPAAQKATT